MSALFYGDTTGSFFNFDSISKNRRIQFPMMPDKYSALLPAATKLKIPPKQPGELRLLSADIALMATTKSKNDASAIFINQLVPTKISRYMNNIVYTESNEGLRTDEEALVLRKLFDEFDCDYIVLDTRNVGLSVFDALSADMTDPNTGDVYPALSCCNNDAIAARCAVKDAPKVIWSIQGSSKFNSDCALLLREGFRAGRIRLLNTEYDAEEVFGEIKGYGALTPSARGALLLPYVNTSLLVNELINLQHEENSGLVRIFEKAGMRKDRYSSLSYNYYVSNTLEKDLAKKRAHESEFDFFDEFVYRAPRTKA